VAAVIFVSSLIMSLAIPRAILDLVGFHDESVQKVTLSCREDMRQRFSAQQG